MILRIYTDGSCPGNPGPAGWGLVVTNPEIDDLTIIYEKFGACTNEKDQVDFLTNQVAEIQAFLSAFQVLLRRERDNKPRPVEVEIFSDSAYVLNCFIEGWYKNWRKYAQNEIWLKANKEPVINQWLWKDTIKLYETLCNLGIKFKFTKVKSHVKPGHPKYHHIHSVLNERADYLAGQGTKLAIENLSTVK